MKHSLLLRAAAMVVVLGALGYTGAYLATAVFGGRTGDPRATLSAPIDEALITRGAYVAVLGDCAACHTAPGGKPFAGGLPIATPIGTVFSTNITPDAATGIGGYSYGEFERAVRRGVTPEGHTLYPAMPYPSYARLTDADTQALYAYFMKGVAPVAAPDKAVTIPWPLSLRWPLTYWRWIFAPKVETATATGQDDPVARGAYIVEGPGHCGACHTPRGLGLQELALTAKDGPAYLSGGGPIDNFMAVNLRGDARTGLGAWSEEDIVRFLKTGHNTHSAVFGGMSDVVRRSMQFATDADLTAIARFLKSLPGTGQEPAFAYDAAQAKKLANLDVSATGALDYMNTCSACHLSSGKGYDNTFPALAGNPVVVSANPVSVINVILKGTTRPATIGAPTDFAMPPFADRLTDQEVADIATFVRSSWGNGAGKVTADDVAKLRKALAAAAPSREAGK